MKKVLTVCEGGRVRSVSARFIFTDHYGCDTIACGIVKNTPETLSLLFAWADEIYLLDGRYVDRIPQIYKHKLKVIDVGPDRWSNEGNSELRQLVADLIRRNGN